MPALPEALTALVPNDYYVDCEPKLDADARGRTICFLDKANEWKSGVLTATPFYRANYKGPPKPCTLAIGSRKTPVQVVLAEGAVKA